MSYEYLDPTSETRVTMPDLEIFHLDWGDVTRRDYVLYGGARCTSCGLAVPCCLLGENDAHCQGCFKSGWYWMSIAEEVKVPEGQVFGPFGSHTRALRDARIICGDE